MGGILKFFLIKFWVVSLKDEKYFTLEENNML